MSTNIIWTEFNGHGFVLEFDVDEVISASAIPNVDVTLAFTLRAAYTGGFSMEDQVGSSIYVTSALAAQISISEGYWTLVDADDALSTITIRAAASTLPGIGAFPSNPIRIEDPYRFSNGIPDFVTGAAARSRWLPILSEDGITPTLGQKLDIQGGVTSFDGLTFELNYVDNPALTRLLRSRVQAAVDTNDDTMVLSSTAGAGQVGVQKFATTAPLGVYVNNDVDFGFEPIFVNREAALIRTVASAGGGIRNLNLSRGLLNTRATWLEESTVIFAGLQTGIGADVIVKKQQKDFEYFEGLPGNDSAVFYAGVVEGIKLDNGLNKVEFSISPSIFKTQKRAVNDNIQGDVELIVDTTDPLGPSIFRGKYISPISNPQSVYQWVKLGGIALRFRWPYPLATPKNPLINVEQLDVTIGRSYELELYIDNIAAVSIPAQNAFNDNGVIVKKADNVEEWEKLSRFVGPTRADSYYDRPRFGWDRTATLAFTSSQVYEFEFERFIGDNSAKGELCHIFESFIEEAALAQNAVNKTVLSDSYISTVSARELILQILCSDFGDGANGPFDVLPYGLGMGIAEARIDYASFGFNESTGQFESGGINSATLGKLSYLFANVIIEPKDGEKVKKWLTENVLKPLNLIIYQNDNASVAIADSTDISIEDGILTITNQDIELNSNGVAFTFSEEYNADKLFDKVVLKEERWWASPIGPQFDTTEYIIPGVPTFLETADGNSVSGTFPEIFSFIATIPINITNKFAAGPTVSDAVNFQTRFAQTYSRIQTEVEFVARADLLSLGDKAILILNNVVNQDGERDIGQTIKCIDKKTSVLSNQAVYKAVVVDNVSSAVRLWAPSAETTPQIVNNPVRIVASRYADSNGVNDGLPATEDVNTFRVGDFVLLYSENFEILSVDGAGNPDPREITNIDTINNELTLNSTFTDGAGVDIPLTVPRIIMQAQKSLNSLDTQSFYAFFNDRQSFYFT
jgi:hypothetical protein